MLIFNLVLKHSYPTPALFAHIPGVCKVLAVSVVPPLIQTVHTAWTAIPSSLGGMGAKHLITWGGGALDIATLKGKNSQLMNSKHFLM